MKNSDSKDLIDCFVKSRQLWRILFFSFKRNNGIGHLSELIRLIDKCVIV